MTPDQIADQGPAALAWLEGHADTTAIWDNPSAYYIANQNQIRLDQAMGLAPSEVALDPGRYLYGPNYIDFLHGSNPAAAFTFAGVGMGYAGVSDAPGAGAGREVGPQYHGPSGGGMTESTRVGRWMSESEYETMSSTGRVVEGGGGRTFVVHPPDPDMYRAGRGVYAEFGVAPLSWTVKTVGSGGGDRLGTVPPLELGG
jgi:hypothetical protein